MTIARRLQIDLDETPYYHCVARCVRRAFLCGDDKPSGRNFDHRKLWILERLKLLAAIFAIDVCAYAILSNHLHLVLRILAEQAAKWTDEEVLRRAGQLCPSTIKGIEDWPEARRKQLVATWRERLSSISWFMGRLCEFIARQANQEDECTGRFWEGRFRCQALLDEGALLACMSYVDLNPVRAGLARGLEDSTWTSIHQRLREVGVGLGEEEGEPEAACAEPAEAQPYPELHSCPRLSPLDGSLEGPANALPMDLFQYVEILQWTGQMVREDKAGRITCPPFKLLRQYGLDPDSWLESVERFGSFGFFVGHPDRLEKTAPRVGRKWLKGQKRARSTYARAA